MPDIEIIRTTDEIESLRDRWKSLWFEDPGATPFQSPEWLLPWWQQFGEGELRTALIREASHSIAILPFYIYPEPASGERKLLLLGAGTSDYLDGIFSPDCQPPHVLAALKILCQDSSWDVAHIPQLRPGSPLVQALILAGAAPMDSDATWRRPAASLARLSRKTRANIRHYRNLAERQGTLQFSVANPADISPALAQLHCLHGARWQARGQAGLLADPRIPAWHRASLPLMAEAGLARLWALQIGAQPAAAFLSLCDPPRHTGNGRAEYIYLSGFDPHFSACSPGMLLFAYAIDRAASEGIATIDFLRGSESYKRLWGAQPVDTVGRSLSRLSGALASAA